MQWSEAPPGGDDHGTITLHGGAGTMAQYNMSRFGVSREAVRVYSALPDISTSQQILIGGAFR